MYMFNSITATSSSMVYLNPITFKSSNVCTSLLDENSTARNSISETLSIARSSYVERKYGGGCGGDGWTKMAYLNMADTNSQCPPNWRLKTTGVRGCGRNISTYYSCESAHFRNAELPYNRVCGRIIAFQKGHTDGFDAYIFNRASTIETAYSAGVLLSHGPAGSRQHIWTFSSGIYKYSTGQVIRSSICPCTISGLSWPHSIPPFVGNDYFCDSGNPGPNYDEDTVYAEDPLWDGAGCPPTSSCCQFNNPPWFYTSLPTTTTDDIEVRLCITGHSEDVLVTLIELYVTYIEIIDKRTINKRFRNSLNS